MTVLVDDIKAVYATDRLDSEIREFLAAALIIVNEDIRSKYTITDDRADIITKYLTAHLIALSDAKAVDGITSGGSVRRAKLGEADESYDNPGADAYGLHSTRWGQTALAFDTTGALTALSTSKLKAQFRVV